ncbi:MAG: methyltransferase [Alkalinema sp. CACIAM 70d]|nr:MAG: methyltransferase [Alkalinema sp. CACIAM 70d]
MSSHSLPPNFFETLYAKNADPWNFLTSEYEAQKYTTTLAALPRPYYDSVLEIGGSIGVFTAQLAPRCHSILSIDVSAAAQEQAKIRCQAWQGVRFQLMQIPQEFPPETFDLVVLSEVGYYWSLPDLQRAKAGILEHLRPQGQIILVHWTVDAENLPLTGEQVHDSFMELVPTALTHLQGYRTPQYRLDLFELV